MSKPVSTGSTEKAKKASQELAGVMDEAFMTNSKAVDAEDDNADDDDGREVELEIRPPEGYTVS